MTWFERPAGVTWRNDVAATGWHGESVRVTTWVQDQRHALLAGLLVLGLLATLLAGINPALAGKPADSGGGLVACDDLSDSSSLAMINDVIGAEDLHDAGITGAGVDIAVIDTGVAPVAGLDTIDGPDLSFDALNDELRNEDLHGHGTNMAAIIAGTTSAGTGVAPDARIIDVKVGAGDGAVDVTQVIAAIDWVVQNKSANGMNIRVINLAYGTDADVSYVSDPLSHAVENAWHNGIVVVAAGGNDGRSIQRLGNPALNPYIIAVGSAELKDQWKVPSWSSTGDGTRNPDVIAPGAAVLSAGVPGSYLAETHPAATCLDESGSLLLRGSGTSQSAAVVSGAVALLLQDRPSLTPNQVKALLTQNAELLASRKQGQSSPLPAHQQGNGMIDLPASLAASTPSIWSAAQLFMPSTGTGSLQASRGTALVGTDGDYLTGDMTAFGGAWGSTQHSLEQALGNAWTNQSWSGATWTGGTWSGATWTGATWSGATWSGATWSGATWSGATWSGATWSGATWSGATWSGATWSGATWS